MSADTKIHANELFSVLAGHLTKLTTQGPGQETFGELYTASCEWVKSLAGHSEYTQNVDYNDT